MERSILAFDHSANAKPLDASIWNIGIPGAVPDRLAADDGFSSTCDPPNLADLSLRSKIYH